VKRSLRHLVPKQHESNPAIFVAAATLGEVAACSIRVPAEVLKQRMQVMRYEVGLMQAARQLYLKEGSLGFYRGFQATIQREIPFACLQYPLYELLRRSWTTRRAKYMASDDAKYQLEPWRGALCGSLAGGITGFLTTPLDVIKTRVMLSNTPTSATNPNHHPSNPIEAMKLIMREEGANGSVGIRRLFAGALPRTAWISLGGFLFFGAYEKSGAVLHRYTSPPSYGV